MMIAVVIAAFFAVRAFVKGIARLVFGMLCLAAGAFVGYQVFLNGREWLAPFAGENPGAKTVLYSAWGAGSFTYGALGLTVRKVLNKIAGKGKMMGPAKVRGALLSLVPSGFFVWVVTMALRASGTVAGLEATSETVDAPDGGALETPSFFERARAMLGKGAVGEILDGLDPVSLKESGALSQLLLLAKDSETMQQAGTNPQLVSLFKDPRVEKLLENSKVREKIAQSDYVALLNMSEVNEVATEPEIRSKLARTPVEEVLGSVLYEQEPAEDGGGVVRRKRKFRRGAKRN